MAVGIYLHFLDRELNVASGGPLGSPAVIRLLRLLAVATVSPLYCGLSAVWENDELSPEALLHLEALFSDERLDTISSDHTLDEFLDSRREAYYHDRFRYPNYFDEGAETRSLGWARPSVRKAEGSTAPLISQLYMWANSNYKSEAKHVPTTFAIRAPISSALSSRENQAVTWTYFVPFLGDLAKRPMTQGLVRRQISAGFTTNYLDFCDADIVTGVRLLEPFDYLAREFPINDARLLRELLFASGLGSLIDPDQTPFERWLKYLWTDGSAEATLLASTIRWIASAVFAAERRRKVPPSQVSDVFRSPLQIVNRIIGHLRYASRYHTRSGSVDLTAEPFEVRMCAQARLIGIANSIGSHDPLVGEELEASRGEIALKAVDIVVHTVNEIETGCLRDAMEAAGFRAQLHYGGVNTYSIYGPIAGTVIAHVRSSMGSGGPQGSSATIQDAIRDLRPWGVIGLGVAFGVDEAKQPIGQLLLSEKLTSYELVRVGTAEDGSLDLRERGTVVPGSAVLLGRFRDSNLESALGTSVLPCQMLSGEKLVDNPEFKAALLKRFPEAEGGEMEGAGLFSASYRQGVEWLVVKAVCDYATSKGVDKVARQTRAASTAARGLIHVLERGGLMRR